MPGYTHVCLLAFICRSYLPAAPRAVQNPSPVVSRQPCVVGQLRVGILVFAIKVKRNRTSILAPLAEPRQQMKKLLISQLRSDVPYRDIRTIHFGQFSLTMVTRFRAGSLFLSCSFFPWSTSLVSDSTMNQISALHCFVSIQA